MRHEDVRVPFLYRAKIKEKQGVRVPFLYTFECSFLGVRFFSRLSQIQIHISEVKIDGLYFFVASSSNSRGQHTVAPSTSPKTLKNCNIFVAKNLALKSCPRPGI